MTRIIMCFLHYLTGKQKTIYKIAFHDIVDCRMLCDFMLHIGKKIIDEKSANTIC